MHIPLFVRIASIQNSKGRRRNCYAIQDANGVLTQATIKRIKRRHVDPAIVAAGKLGYN